MGILQFMASCSPNGSTQFDRAPIIELLGLSQDTLKQFEDTLLITLFYKDSNGDLGFENPNQNAIFVRDNRFANFDGFYLGPIAPIDQSISIQGQLILQLPHLFILGSAKSENTNFTLYLIDREGNKSNEIDTPPVNIKR
jgi:hypothetical protein